MASLVAPSPFAAQCRVYHQVEDHRARSVFLIVDLVVKVKKVCIRNAMEQGIDDKKEIGREVHLSVAEVRRPLASGCPCDW